MGRSYYALSSWGRGRSERVGEGCKYIFYLKVIALREARLPKMSLFILFVVFLFALFMALLFSKAFDCFGILNAITIASFECGWPLSRHACTYNRGHKAKGEKERE